MRRIILLAVIVVAAILAGTVSAASPPPLPKLPGACFRVSFSYSAFPAAPSQSAASWVIFVGRRTLRQGVFYFTGPTHTLATRVCAPPSSHPQSISARSQAETDGPCGKGECLIAVSITRVPRR